MNIVGLGHAGTSIAKLFSSYEQYEIYYIDSDESLKETPNSFVFEKYTSPEEYERNCPELNKFFEKISSDALFIVGGSGMISGASLRILEQLKRKDCNISVLYIQPNVEFLFGERILQERVTFNVFQQYARSGVFEKLYLVNNDSIEECLGDIAVSRYFEALNEAIVSTLHMINVWSNSQQIMGNLTNSKETERICTFGVMNVETGEEKIFFPLQNVTDKKIFYAINNETLKKESSLHNKIRNQIKDKMDSNFPNSKVSFGIYPTDYPSNQAYVLNSTKIIDLEKEEEEG